MVMNILDALSTRLIKEGGFTFIFLLFSLHIQKPELYEFILRWNKSNQDRVRHALEGCLNFMIGGHSIQVKD